MENAIYILAAYVIAAGILIFVTVKSFVDFHRARKARDKAS